MTAAADDDDANVDNSDGDDSSYFMTSDIDNSVNAYCSKKSDKCRNIVTGSLIRAFI